ncbi:hybrid nucleoside-diphosphate sugar epimerase/sugar transferase [Ahrensia kielensis]|uniref:hybrid nucleoside-diphosphate sugar epimerase/sugar transferase n=1 Tax=Ahrensia kielensis TaxID=76980 RepID=UPI00035EE915|nr:hybrid nucleoside-diphosphate sugar epimerase/sugar transferase [Ahrensia kielensis]
MAIKIAIPGASGFVGRQIVPLLEAKGYELVLIGRHKARLAAVFPNRRVFDYDDLDVAFSGVDAILHLAVLNNNVVATAEEFEIANIDLLKNIILKAKTAKVDKIIYTATIHQQADKSNYAHSKNEAERFLNDLNVMRVTIIRLPIVHGERFAGKLSLLNALPYPLARYIVSVLASFKVTLHITKLANCIDAELNSKASNEILLTDQQDGNLFYAIVCRFVDVGFSISIIVVFWWLLIVVWLAVKLTSEGTGIFVQQRVGRCGKVFSLYKFRTMVKGTKQVGSHEINGSSLTKIGKFLRKTKIDELPQIFNILRGNMSLIGPRPCLMVQQELVSARWKRGVFDVLPGITGYAQVQNIDMSNPELLAKVDEEYIKLRTLPLDFRILVSTILGWKDNRDLSPPNRTI